MQGVIDSESCEMYGCRFFLFFLVLSGRTGLGGYETMPRSCFAVVEVCTWPFIHLHLYLNSHLTLH